jgi:hypothetical protein
VANAFEGRTDDARGACIVSELITHKQWYVEAVLRQNPWVNLRGFDAAHESFLGYAPVDQ